LSYGSFFFQLPFVTSPVFFALLGRASRPFFPFLFLADLLSTSHDIPLSLVYLCFSPPLPCPWDKRLPLPVLPGACVARLTSMGRTFPHWQSLSGLCFCIATVPFPFPRTLHRIDVQFFSPLFAVWTFLYPLRCLFLVGCPCPSLLSPWSACRRYPLLIDSTSFCSPLGPSVLPSLLGASSCLRCFPSTTQFLVRFPKNLQVTLFFFPSFFLTCRQRHPPYGGPPADSSFALISSALASHFN